jgi:hypothetical protein
VTASPRIGALLAALSLLALALPAGADARRSVPQRFIGTSLDGALASVDDPNQDAQFARMAAGGVETLRVAFSWSRAQPSEDGPIDLSATDRIVERASARNMEVLPHVIVAPNWNRWKGSSAEFAPPEDPSLLQPLMTALIGRYGPRGTFWSDHPELPRLPIRQWQFWNEPELPFQWTLPKGDSWSESYTWELKYFYAAVKSNDPGAKVVLGGLTNQSWVALRDLYREGIHGYYDIAAIHPYTVQPAGVVELVRRFRAVMNHWHDGGKTLYVTELGLPASRGHAPSRNTLQTTDSGMARFLERTYAALARARRKRSTRVSRVYWYTWSSPYSGDFFGYAGLFKYRGDGEPEARPAFSAYVRNARRMEGCRKTETGVCR